MALPDNIQNKKLRSIAEKVRDNIPVGEEDALYMLTTDDILDLGAIAHYIRTKFHGDIAYYGVNMNLNYTNICELRCPLCAFSCDENDEKAFLLSPDDIEQKIYSADSSGIDEVHIVGGLHPNLTIDYFEQMLRIIKKIKPDMHIVAFTAVEYDYFAKKNKIPIEEVFKRLMDAGVEALPGGGAEYAYEDSPTEKVYIVLEGEITVKTKKEELTLGPMELLYIAPNEGREIINKTNKPVSMMVAVSY